MNASLMPILPAVVRRGKERRRGVGRGVCPGQPCSVMLTDRGRLSRIMEKLSFCNAQMRLSLVLQLFTGSRRDAVFNRGSI